MTCETELSTFHQHNTTITTARMSPKKSNNDAPDRLNNLSNEQRRLSTQEVEDLLNFEGESVQQEESQKVIDKIETLKNKKNHTKEDKQWIEENSIIYHSLGGKD